VATRLLPGHFAIRYCDFNRSRVIIGGMYSVFAGGYAASMEVFEEFYNKLRNYYTVED
jgi:hypothetical protein